MPLPLVALGITGLRAASPYIGSALASAAPAIKDKALTLFRQATSGRVQSVDQAVTYAAQSKNNLAVVAINAAKAGVNPQALLPDALVIDQNNAELTALQGRVKTAFANSYGKIDASSSIVADGTQETAMLAMAVINDVSNIMGIRADAALSAAHVKMRMWLAMSEQEHTQALQMRRVARGIAN